MLRKRITPVVVSSIPPMISGSLGPRGMQRGDEIAAIIHRHVRFMIECSIYMAIIGRLILAFDGKGRNAILADQSSRDIVLRRERIGRAKHDISSSSL